MTWILYSKAPDSKQFKPMDLAEGQQVDKLIYATLLSKEEAQNITDKLRQEYPDWQWQARRANS